MGAADLREAFNAVAAPRYTASKALLNYERKDDTDFQRLTFSGHAADGTPFEVKSDLLRPGTDVNQAARDTAQRLIGQ